MYFTTVGGVPGYRAIRTLGLVVACVPYFGSKYAEGISDLKGRTTTDVSAALENRRREVLARLERTARAVGADAVIGVVMDVREITTSWKELCAYGTAVVLTKED